jgi:hypothetical protein
MQKSNIKMEADVILKTSVTAVERPKKQDQYKLEFAPCFAICKAQGTHGASELNTRT